MTNWPAELPPSPLADGFSEEFADTTLRTAMDAGPDKVRQRTTAGCPKLTVSFILSRSQMDTLDSFYRSDLSGGASSFTFTHPRTGASCACRFKKPPLIKSMNGEKFRAYLEMEILP